MNFLGGEIEWQKELKHEIRKGHKVPFLHLPFLVEGEKNFYHCAVAFIPRNSQNVRHQSKCIGRKLFRETEKSTIRLSMPSDVICFLSSESKTAILFPRLSTVLELL